MSMAIVAENPQSSTEKNPIQRQMTALIAGCAVYKVDRVLFSLTGRDRVRWLNGMVSNNIRDLTAGQGVYAFVLNAQGQIQGDLYAFNRGESLLVEIERGQVETLLPLLRRYIIMDKVEIEDLGATITGIGIAGPKCGELLRAVGLVESQIVPLQSSEVSWNSTPAILIRGDNSVTENYEVWISADQVDALWSALLAAGGAAVDAETLEHFRIASGIPKVGVDIRERILPQETGQDRALSFTKGCYIGQEIVERIRARGAVHRMFVGFEIEGPAPTAGTKVHYNGKEVGEITSVASALLRQKRLGLGYLRKEAMIPDRLFSAGGATVRVAPLPFTEIFH